MSLINIRKRLSARMRDEESGFSLVELLVVMLILGLLAAIAIPAFFNQRDKAQDADAKAAARSAQTAIETYATDNEGSYAGATVDILVGIEDTLNDADLVINNAVEDSYELTANSDTGNTFTIERAATGETALTCATPDGGSGEGGCPEGGAWGGDDGVIGDPAA